MLQSSTHTHADTSTPKSRDFLSALQICLCPTSFPYFSDQKSQFANSLLLLPQSISVYTSPQFRRKKKHQIEQRTHSSLSLAATPLLVPLTTSLYVPAKPSPQKTLLIDIGTGYYISKTPEQAKTYYEAKVKDLNESLSGIERVVGVKSGDLRVVEDVLREKVLAGQQEQQQAQQQQQGKEKRSTKT